MSKALQPAEIQFLYKLVVASNTRETYWEAWNNPKTVNRLIKLLNKYGKNRIYKIIDILKKHEQMHADLQKDYGVDTGRPRRLSIK